ncbi:MAG: hypothetical protein AAF936_03110 [Pseudomonadota bacterium]
MSDLVQIAQFYDPEEAYCAKSYLQSHGIDTFVQNDHHLTMAPWMRVALGGYRLLAVDTEAAEAKKALSEVQAIQPEQIGIQPEPSSVQLQPAKRKSWGWLPIAFMTGVPFLPIYKSWRSLILHLAVLLIIYAMLLGLGYTSMMHFRTYGV